MVLMCESDVHAKSIDHTWGVKANTHVMIFITELETLPQPTLLQFLVKKIPKEDSLTQRSRAQLFFFSCKAESLVMLALQFLRNSQSLSL